MNVLREDPIETQPMKALRATERLESLLEEQDAELEEILRFVPGLRAIFSGRFGGQPAIFRLSLSARTRTDQADRMKELQRVRSYMHDGALQVPEPLALLAEGSVSVTRRIEAAPLMEQLWAAAPSERAALTAQSADWLLTYARPSMAWRPERRRPWRNWAQEAVARQPHPKLRRSEEKLLKKMHALARARPHRETWRVAQTHGDFHPNNLLRDSGGTLWGVDLSAANTAPIYRDMARFLVHLARRNLTLGETRLFGVDAAAYAAFCRSFALSESETWGHLPFFLCYETLVRVEHPRLPQRRINRARDLTEALFDDMKILLKQGPDALRDRMGA